MIGLFYLAVLATVPLAGGRLAALADLQLRRPCLAVAAILMQIVVISILPAGSHAVHTTVHIASYLLLGRVRVLQPAHRRRADRRARGAAELHRHHRQRRRDAGRPQGAGLAPAGGRQGRLRQLAGARAPAPPVPRRRLRHAGALAACTTSSASATSSCSSASPCSRTWPAAAASSRAASPPRGSPPPDVPGGAQRRALAAVLPRARPVVPGDGPRALALPLLAYDRFHNAEAVSAVLLVGLLPAIAVRHRCSARSSTASAGGSAPPPPTSCAASRS